MGEGASLGSDEVSKDTPSAEEGVDVFTIGVGDGKSVGWGILSFRPLLDHLGASELSIGYSGG